jgi:hypothetical protein
MPFNPERITLPLYDENGNSLPGCSDRPQLRLAAMMWHLAAHDELERLRARGAPGRGAPRPGNANRVSPSLQNLGIQ